MGAKKSIPAAAGVAEAFVLFLEGYGGADAAATVTLFLSGDVMTGRGIDQILAHPSHPELHEPYVESALEYVALAERASGPIPRPVDGAYVWGDALAEFERMAPDLRIVNLETAVTRSDAWEHKGINYRMHPGNVSCLTAARIDCCVLANNHVLDWGRTGLEETLATLQRAGLKTAGAGREIGEAAAAAVLEPGRGGRVLVFACAARSSGVPAHWAASASRAGVNLLPDLSEATVQRIARQVHALKRPGDIAVASLHWGGNWGYRIPEAHRAFAQGLIDAAAIDLVHGHSSHHPLGIEVYRDKLILYGCGDLLNDYEGIGGQEAFRGELALMYFVDLAAASGRLAGLTMSPFRIRRFRLERAGATDAAWLQRTLDRESAGLGCRVGLRTGRA